MIEKPFPWNCPNCRQKAVEKAVVDYDNVIEPDGREYRVEINRLEVPRCQKCGMIVLTDQANKAIDDALRREAKLLMPAQIKQNREVLGFTQRELATRLAISDATLCRWETGAQIQQRSLDRWMRSFFADEIIRQNTADEAKMASLGATVGQRLS